MNSRKIHFIGTKGSLEIRLSEDEWGFGEVTSMIISVKDIEVINGKHPAYGLWECFCQDDRYNTTLSNLDIQTIWFE